MSAAPSPVTSQIHPVEIAGETVPLPIVAINPEFAISLLMVIDCGVRFGARVGEALARRVAPLEPEIVVGTATLGIPVAIEVTRALGLDHYVVLQKSPKLHLADALRQAITSITSKGEQTLLLDRRAVGLLAGKRVLLVDDVVATGSSLKGALALLREAGAHVVGIGVILTEAHDWKDVLGNDAELVQGLAHIPQFRPGPEGWEAIPGTV